jgi:hypothetical protein
MKHLKLLVLALVAVVSLAVPSFAQVSDTYLIPAVAYASGANGTTWATKMSVFNPQGYDLKISLTFIPTGGTTGTEVILTVPPNVSASTDNVLQEWFDRSGTGALAVATFKEDNPTVPDEVIARSFVVTSNTFNNSISGTFGQTIPGTRVSLALLDFANDGITGIVSGVTNNSSAVSGFRTNIGALNTGRTSVTLQVTVRDRSGNIIVNKAPFLVPPQAHFQDRLPVPVEKGSIEFFVSDPSHDGAIYAYASVIDNKSGDPQYLEPVLLASPNTFPRKMSAVDKDALTKANIRALAAGAIRIGEIRAD